MSTFYRWWNLSSEREERREVAQSCLTLRGPMDCSPPGSSIHGFLQARLLGWVAISFSRGASWPQGSNVGLLHCRQTLYRLSHQGSQVNWSKLAVIEFEPKCMWFQYLCSIYIPLRIQRLLRANSFISVTRERDGGEKSKARIFFLNMWRQFNCLFLLNDLSVSQASVLGLVSVSVSAKWGDWTRWIHTPFQLKQQDSISLDNFSF